MEDVEATSKSIESMEIRGAGKIARSAALALSSMAKGYMGDDFHRDIRNAAERLLATRPTAVSLHNAVAYSLRGLDEVRDVGKARHLVMNNAKNFVERSEDAIEKIIEMASNRVPSSSKVLTHCNSTAAVVSIVRAFQKGKLDMAYCTESRPKRQGLITSKQLADAGVPVTMIVDSAVRFIMPKIDMVIVGADTIASNGAVVNKIGTSQVALCAHEARVPVTVCAESYKFSPMTLMGERIDIEERPPSEIMDPAKLPGVRFFNPVFDFTPPEYVDAVITEFGVMSPYTAYELIVREFADRALTEGTGRSRR